jgi:hypothetical protein
MGSDVVFVVMVSVVPWLYKLRHKQGYGHRLPVERLYFSSFGCIFGQKNLPCVPYNFLLYFQHSIRCSQGAVWLVLKSKSYVFLREYTTWVVFRR